MHTNLLMSTNSTSALSTNSLVQTATIETVVEALGDAPSVLSIAYPVVTKIRSGEFSCDCSDCSTEATLAQEFGSSHSAVEQASVQTRRLELRKKYIKRKLGVMFMSAYQVAMLETGPDRLAAIVARLDQLRDGRKALWIDCDAFWALVEEHRVWNESWFDLPTRAQHDDEKLRFAKSRSASTK